MRRDLGRLYKQGESIFQQGDPAGCMYVVQKGQVELVVESEYGKKQLALLNEGDVFGEVSLFANKSHFATATATEHTTVLTLDEKEFVSKLHRDPSLAFHTIRQMAHRIYDQDQALMRGFFDERSRAQCTTGFASYIDLVAMVESELRRAKRLWQPLALAIVDIDQFDILYEKFRTVIGEDLFLVLGNTLRETLRRQDVIGRFGTEHFGLLLYEADGQAAMRVLEKVHRLLTSLWGRVENSDVTATFNCGVATFPEYKNYIELNKAAYRALVSSKKDGNRIVLADPTQ